MRPEPNPTERLVRKYLQRQEEQKHTTAATVLDDNDDDEEEMLRTGTNNKRSNESSASSNLTTEEYYRRLLGVPAPALSSALGQKSAAIQKAYAAAVHHYQLERTEGMSEEQALEAVETLLAEQSLKEKQASRERAVAAQRHPRTAVVNVAAKKTGAVPEPQHPTDSLDASQEQADASTMDSQQTPSPGDGDSDKQETGTADRGFDSSFVASIFHASPRTVEAMMRWSERLQAVPYQQWTVGASTALDHWIARKLLSLSEETWLALLEGEEPTLLSAGRDIVAVRESLFPETRLDDHDDHNVMETYAGDDVDEGIDRAADLEQTERHEAMMGEDHTSKQPREKTIEELLASLGGLDDDDDSSSSSESSAALFSSGWDTTTTTAASRRQGDATESNELDAQVDQLVEQLQDWRRMNQATPYKDWSADDKDEFNTWLKEYISVLTSDAAEKGRVDYDTTREALLAEPPVSRSESEHFWNQLQDEGHARALLDDMRRDGPPPGASILQQSFWDLDYDNQLERLLNLGAVRPLVDEYTKESDRLRFLQRHADTLLEGVPLQYLVPDPNGPIKASDLPASVVAGADRTTDGNGSSSHLAIPPDARFRLELRPYKSAAVGSSTTNDDDGDELLLAAEEKSRALFKAWNQHKAGRAKYEERLFQTGRLGLQYSDKILADHEWGDDDNDDDDSNKDDS